MIDMSRYIVNPGPRTPATGLKAAVSTDSAIVTETMIDILRKGGNAVDASVAGALVQAAVEPCLTNHAGQVTYLYYEAKTGKIHQLDSLGAYPSGLPPFMPIPPSISGYAGISPSAIIPGFMPGMKAMHGRYGTLQWRDLCAPAVEWAERGHPVSTLEYNMTAHMEKIIAYFPEGREFYQPKGMFTHVGETFVPKGLAATLRGVAEQGPEFMISGAWAQKFVAKANAMGWKIRLEHMSETPPRWIEPIRFPHHDYEIASLGPPQAQGLYLAVALGVLKHLGIRNTEPGTAEHFWAMGHALRQAARHWEYAQDDTVYGVPKEEILDDTYHAHLAKMIRKSRPLVDLTDHIRLVGLGFGAKDFTSDLGGQGAAMPRLGNSESAQPTGSCEIAVVDSEGNWVQMMNTIQGSGIPGMVIDGVPMMGSNATFGSLMSPIDATLHKGAKTRCVIGNTLVMKAGRPVMSAGSPGNVFCTVPQVLTYALDFKLDPSSAVHAPRMLPMSEARGVVIEDRISQQALQGLHRLGVRVGVLPGYDIHMGSFSVIARDETSGLYTSVADPRRAAVADGIR